MARSSRVTETLSTSPNPSAALAELAGGDWFEKVERAFPETAVPRLFRTAMQRTIADTIRVLTDDTVFVVTGDIPAMWLRDSATQMWPYLVVAAARPEGAVADLIAGVLRRQFAFIALDPYANAFNAEPSSRAHDDRDLNRHPMVWERKYEVDSLCFPVQLAHRYWRLTGRTDFLGADFATAARAIVDTLEREREHAARSEYRFVRPGANPLDTLAREGRGAEVAWTGMTWSGFRPSDDACERGYNVPANLFASSALRQLAELAAHLGDDSVKTEASVLSQSLHDATFTHGVVDLPDLGRIFAYETDGLGNDVLMDDANLPSLLGLPLVADIDRRDPLYHRTRDFVLSEANPFYYSGSAASGVGSPHTWPGYVWPIALAVDGLTSDSIEHQRRMCTLIAETTAGTGAVHESFDVEDPTRFTRPWFSWADSMFCQLALEVAGESLTSMLRARGSH